MTRSTPLSPDQPAGAVFTTGPHLPLRHNHEALFFSGDDEFLSETVRFIDDARVAGEPVAVVVEESKASLLRNEVPEAPGEVQYVNMEALGCNPARLIPFWMTFARTAPESGARAIAQPVWPNRSAAECDEFDRHEDLLNLALASTTLWMLCPYDRSGLSDAQLDRANHCHPFVRQAGSSNSSSGYQELSARFDGVLDEPPSSATRLVFDQWDLPDIRHLLPRHALKAGLPLPRAEDLVAAVNEVTTNSVVHGGGSGELRIWEDPPSLVCEIRDRGHITDPLAGRRVPGDDQSGGRGLWLANQLADLVQIRSSDVGTTVRLRFS